MNSYECILKTFRGESTDKVPVYHIGFSSQVASKLLNREAYIGGAYSSGGKHMPYGTGRMLIRNSLNVHIPMPLR